MPCQNDNKIYDVYVDLKTDIKEGDYTSVLLPFVLILIVVILFLVLMGVIVNFIKVRRLAKRAD